MFSKAQNWCFECENDAHVFYADNIPSLYMIKIGSIKLILLIVYFVLLLFVLLGFTQIPINAKMINDLSNYF